ncbi:MAG: sodium:solute symporter [Sphingomonadales bacterium]|nr:MAG: sodium:solute symporter [Sphingomonadales bacterium]
MWAGRGAKSDADYLVAGRSLGAGAVGMSLFATWFASESLIATSGEVARDGLAGARAEPFAYAIGILAIALFFAYRLRSGGFITIADFLRSRFGPGTESLAAIVIALSATTWSAAQLFAFATIISSASGLDFTTGLIGATLLVMTYTMFGGLAGDVVTDIVQGAIIILAILLLFALMVDASGGVAAMWAAAPPTVWSFTAPGESWTERIELWLIPIAGTMVSQEALARTLAARSPEVARRGALWGAAIYLTVGLIPVSLGLFGPQLGPALGITLGADEAYLPSLAKALFPPSLYILFTGALISAILSSVDSALLAVSAVVTESGYRRLRPEASPLAMLRAARMATVGAAAVASVLAAQGESLRDLVLDAGAIAAVLAVPIIAGLAGSTARRAALAAIVVQGCVLGVLDWGLALPGAFLWMAASGLATFAAVAAVTPQPQEPAPRAPVGDT